MNKMDAIRAAFKKHLKPGFSTKADTSKEAATKIHSARVSKK